MFKICRLFRHDTVTVYRKTQNVYMRKNVNFFGGVKEWGAPISKVKSISLASVTA